MLSKEEYKRQLVRMWDSLRKSRYKGREDCQGVYCDKCPFEPYCEDCIPKMIDLAEIVEIVENWAKNHPIATNADKFEETFGFKAPMNRCIQSDVYCAECKYYEINGERGACRADERFWNAEYKEPKKVAYRNVTREAQRNERSD